MPNIVMNSLVSATKVITNDTIPNPIVSAHNTMIPSIPVPVTSLGIPIMTMKSQDEQSIEIDKVEEKPFSDEDDEKTLDSNKKDVEPMPVELEDDSVLEAAAKIEENICEGDVDVPEVNVNSLNSVTKNGEHTTNETNEKHGNVIGTTEALCATEPMECASLNSPKHTMATDVVMAESVSVRDCIASPKVRKSNFPHNCRRHRRVACKWKAPTLH